MIIRMGMMMIMIMILITMIMMMIMILIMMMIMMVIMIMVMMMMILALIMIMIMMGLMITRVLQESLRLAGQVRPRPAVHGHHEPPRRPVVLDGLHADWQHAGDHAAQVLP